MTKLYVVSVLDLDIKTSISLEYYVVGVFDNEKSLTEAVEKLWHNGNITPYYTEDVEVELHDLTAEGLVSAFEGLRINIMTVNQLRHID